MNFSYYDSRINKRTQGKYDITPLFLDAVVFTHLINDLIKLFKHIPFDKVAGLEALGLILGAAIAVKMKKGFVPVRKGGKLPIYSEDKLVESFKDYSSFEKSLELGRESIRKGDRVLVVDDWIETGAQVKAAARLITKLGGKVVGISALVCEKNKNTAQLCKKYVCVSIR